MEYYDIYYFDLELNGLRLVEHKYTLKEAIKRAKALQRKGHDNITIVGSFSKTLLRTFKKREK